MNRIDRWAYELGWAARNTGLKLDVVVGLPLKDTVETCVLMGDRPRRAARRGFEDAECVCGHLWEDHLEPYGCQGQVLVDEIVFECICTSFASMMIQRRRAIVQETLEARRRKRYEEGEFAEGEGDPDDA